MKNHPGHVWRLLKQLGWSCQRPTGRALERKSGGGPPLKAQRALADTKTPAAAQGQTIVFVDESGLTERPHRCRTWASRGQTPILHYHFNWNLLSAIAGPSKPDGPNPALHAGLRSIRGLDQERQCVEEARTAPALKAATSLAI